MNELGVVYMCACLRHVRARVMEVAVVSCQLCSVLSPNLRAHISHIRQVHSKDPNLSIAYGIQQCSQRFSTFGAYNSHVYRVHRSALGLDTPSAVDDDEQSLAEPTCSTDPESEMCPAFCFEHRDTPTDIQYDASFGC